MSTFNGIVDEFPDIAIDNFRCTGRKPPLACFLSHVHTDHLVGLESYQSPFVYCSPATRQLLLRLERYPSRMNFAKGILERRQQHYKHLRKVLVTIPLNTPTDIELKPHYSIRVTLLDANHCSGAVMFLIQDSVKAILYTGDIRSEPWWVESLLRNPVIIPFAQGLKRLDKIYLDTTFATNNDTFRQFPTKAEGIAELLKKIAKYPPHTIFHFHAWTLGYEDVWIALSNALNSLIHVDAYKSTLYKALQGSGSVGNPSFEGSALVGHQCGNHSKPGCLTLDHTVRLHSCEHGTGCPALRSDDTVFIVPILNRSHAGEVVPELGAGGGGTDFTPTQEIDMSDREAVKRLIHICKTSIPNPRVQAATIEFIRTTSACCKTIKIKQDESSEDEDIKLPDLVRKLACSRTKEKSHPGQGAADDTLHKVLPKRIVFPYSRHSSYDELCHLVEKLRPGDIYPCTTEGEAWSSGAHVQNLFGSFCTGPNFAYDVEMSLLQREHQILRGQKRRRESASSAASICSTEGSTVAEGDVAGARIRQSLDTRRSLPPSPTKNLKHVRESLLGVLDEAGQSPENTPSLGEPRLKTKQEQKSLNQGNRSFRSYSGLPHSPIEISDDEAGEPATTAAKEEYLPQKAEDMSPSTMPATGSQTTVLTLSDAAFDSQASLLDTIGATALWRRKKAYKSAKNPHESGNDTESTTIYCVNRSEQLEL